VRKRHRKSGIASASEEAMLRVRCRGAGEALTYVLAFVNQKAGDKVSSSLPFIWHIYVFGHPTKLFPYTRLRLQKNSRGKKSVYFFRPSKIFGPPKTNFPYTKMLPPENFQMGEKRILFPAIEIFFKREKKRILFSAF